MGVERGWSRPVFGRLRTWFSSVPSLLSSHRHAPATIETCFSVSKRTPADNPERVWPSILARQHDSTRTTRRGGRCGTGQKRPFQRGDTVLRSLRRQMEDRLDMGGSAKISCDWTQHSSAFAKVYCPMHIRCDGSLFQAWRWYVALLFLYKSTRTLVNVLAAELDRPLLLHCVFGDGWLPSTALTGRARGYYGPVMCVYALRACRRHFARTDGNDSPVVTLSHMGNPGCT